MEGQSLIPSLLNIVIALLTAVSAILILRRPSEGRFAELKQPFARGAMLLWAIRSIGFSVIYLYLLVQHLKTGSPDRTDPIILSIIDVFSVLSLWTWLSILRGDPYSGNWETFTQICTALMIVVPVDLWLSVEGYPGRLLPSILLNQSSFVVAIGTSIFRYRSHSLKFIVAYSIYTWLQIPAYQAALLGNHRPEGWVYYALALGKVVNFVLICDLLLKQPKVTKSLPLIPLMTKPVIYLGVGPSIAFLALILSILERLMPWSENPVEFLLLTVLVPAIAFGFGLWERFGKHNEDERRGRGASAST